MLKVITLNLAITLRVTLVRDFVKSLLTLYIYITFKRVCLYKTGYRVPFKHDYFRIKEIRNIINTILSGVNGGSGLVQFWV